MEDFVSYKIAVKLKEKGFKEKCIHNQAEWSPFIDAPTISQVLK